MLVLGGPRFIGSRFLMFVGDHCEALRMTLTTTDATRLTDDNRWRPREAVTSGVRRTVQWDQHRPDRIEGVSSGRYRDWMDTNRGAWGATVA